jgi:HEAT repeat protein
MQNLLSDGKELAALRSARNLMDSESVETRSAALETFQWLGKRALPEITEMINDKNSFVSSEAMQAWEMAFGEIEGEHRKASVIEDTLKNLAKQDDINAILMHTSELELRIALPMLSRIIEANKTSVLGECARENYTFITDGEIYETPGKTLEFLKGIQ